MIEKDVSDGTLVQEFSTPHYTDREKLIRQLVQIGSLVILGLLVTNFSDSIILDEYLTAILGIFSLVLLLILLMLFLIGLGVSFFQLRFVNERRRKTTNLGGTIGLFGLLLTSIPCTCELLLPGGVQSNILTVVLGLGLFLTVIGVFAEVSQIDEIVIYFVRLNFGVFVRYIFTAVGAFLVNWGILTIFGLFLFEWGVFYLFIWPGNMLGGVALVIIGIFIVWGSWFRQINQVVWENRVFIFRSVELSISLILIITSILFLYSIPNSYQTLSEAINIFGFSVIIGVSGLLIGYVDLYISKIKIKHQFSGVTRILSVIFMSLIGGILIFGGFFVQLSLEWLIIQFYYSGMGILLLYRVWFDNVNHFTKKTIQTSVWFFTTYYRHLITVLALCLMIIGFVSWSVVEGAFLLFFVGYLSSVVIWHIPSRHNYFRGVTTTMSVVLFIWGLVQFILAFDLLTFIIYTGTGTVLPLFLWRVELKELMIRVIKAVIATLVGTIQTISQFLQAYYQHLVTIIALCLMTFELIVWTVIEGAFIIFFVAYLLGVGIWHVPSRHNNFREIATTFSVVLFIWGLVQLILVFNLLIFFIYGGTGIVLPLFLWRVEIKQLILQIVLAFGSFLSTYYRHLVTIISLVLMTIGSILHRILVGPNPFAFFTIFLFIFGYICGSMIWYKHSNFRGITTSLSSVVSIWGLFLLSVVEITEFSTPLLITGGLIIIGLGVDGYLWRRELGELLIKIVAVVTTAAWGVIQAIWLFLKTYYRELVSLVCLGFILIGFLSWVNLIGVAFLFFYGGYSLIVIIWRFPTRHEYFRGVTTTLSTLLLFWGSFQLFFNVELIFRLFVFLCYFGTGSTISIVIWRVELKWLFYRIGNAAWQFLSNYYRHLVTVIAVDLMIIGSLGPWIVGSNNFFDLFFISIFILGYICGCMIWYKHSKFRGITTTLSFVVMIWGLLLLSVVDITEFSTLLIAGGLIITGMSVDGYLWRKELLKLIVKITNTTVNFIKRGYHAILNSLRVTWKALKRTWGSFSQFIRNYRWELLKYSSTFIGLLLLLAGPPLMALIFTTTIESILDLFVRAIGLVFIILAWHKEIIRILKAISTTLVQAVDNFMQFLQKYRLQILKYSSTLIGVLLLLAGPPLMALIFALSVEPIFDLFVRVIGLVVIALAWHKEIIRILKVTWTTLVQAVDNFVQFLGKNRWEILKYSSTFIGFLILLAGSSLMALIFATTIELILDLFVRVIGLVVIALAWHKEIIRFLKASWAALKQAWGAFINFLKATGTAIGQALRDLFTFLRKYRWEILKYSGTLIGVLLLLAGPPLLALLFATTIDPILGLLIRTTGLGFVVLAWHREIMHFLKASWTALKRAWKSLKKIVSETFTQIVDLTIPISMFAIAIIIGLYGFLLVVTMLIDPNHIFDRLLIENIPLLEIFAQIFQPGRYASEGWGGEWGGSLLGFFNGFPQIINVVLGAFIVAAALYIMYIVGLKYRENLRLKTLLKTSESPANISTKKRV